MQTAQTIINDVTGFNPVPVWGVLRPGSVEEVQEALRRTDLPVSFGGGHFSIGGQTASPGSLHIDLRDLDKVLHFAPQARTLRVQAGIRWCAVQRFIDPHGLAVGVMPRFGNFTVGGSLAANAFGRNVGQAPVAESVRAITLVLPNGERAEATPTRNSRLFFAAIGGFGAVGLIVEVELALADNVRLQRTVRHLPVGRYAEWFSRQVRNAPQAVFHHADLMAPDYRQLRAETWSETPHAVSEPARLRPPEQAGAWRRRLRWALRWWQPTRVLGRRVVEPLQRLARPVHWRNHEAARDLGSALPVGGRAGCIVHTSFVVAERLDAFVMALRDVLTRHAVRAVEVQITQLSDDPGCLLAFTRGETFAVELVFPQANTDPARERVAVWVRELIDAVLELGGSYHLPYQPHATPEQFHAAYPHAEQLFAIKREFDPDYRLRSMLWDKYYVPWLQARLVAEGEQVALPVPSGASPFHRVYARVPTRDAFYRHLQASPHGFAADSLHAFVRHACRTHGEAADIYRHLQQQLPAMRAGLAAWRRARPRRLQQQYAFRHGALELLGERRQLSGYLEVGSAGRYLASLRARLGVRGDVAVMSRRAPGNPLQAWLNNGGRVGPVRWLPLENYTLAEGALRDNSLDMVCCGEGLHHIAPDALPAFLADAYRVLRPGGMLLLCEHDVCTAEDADFVDLAHAVDDAIAGLGWEAHSRQVRHFAPLEEWARRIVKAGFSDEGARVDLPGDHCVRVLAAFTKRGLSGARA